MTLRTLAKRCAEQAAVLSGLPVLARRGAADGVLVLAYHNVVPHGEPPGGDRSLHLPQADFAAQLDHLARTHDVVPLETLGDDWPPVGRRPRAAITFDDAYCGAMTVGVDELARRGLPATVFVAPAFVGRCSFWWDAVEGAAEVETRERALQAQRGEDARVREWARAAGRAEREVPAHACCATLAELHAAERRGVSVASHSWSHPNLARLDDAELAAELARPLAWLHEHFRNVLPWLAYPYGRSAPHVERAAERAGYRGALLVSGGRASCPPPNAWAVPRLDVPAGVSLQGFVLRASGVLRA